MPDFACSLYLGLRHPKGSLAPWQSLTTGAPAALKEPERSTSAAQAFAKLMGCGRGVLSPSTLHLFWDLFGMLSRRSRAIYIDSEAYPITKWGAERAAGKGVAVHRFPHHDSAGLQKLLSSNHIKGACPLIVSDGLCPECARVAPIKEYWALAKSYGGLLILDDTQALGILGRNPGPGAPFGMGGGGVLPWNEISLASEVLVVSSLAKGFGVPAAILAGSDSNLQKFMDESETRVHCSPPSMAAVSAAEHAIMVNASYGEELRKRLMRNVNRFRRGLAATGLSASGGLFPVQTLRLSPRVKAFALYHDLLGAGVKTVLLKARNGSSPRLCFIMTSLHSEADIDRAVDILNYFVHKKLAARMPLKIPGHKGNSQWTK